MNSAAAEHPDAALLADFRARCSTVFHPTSTCRMGASAADSVTDSFGRTWDVDNLVVSDGGVFTTNAHKNPTLTIMALAVRSTDYLMDEMKKGSL